MQPVYAIKLDHPDFAAYVTESGHPLKELEHLGRVNLFVGANNSGKSRMLRRLACMAAYKYKLDRDGTFRLGQDLRALLQETAVLFTRAQVDAHGDVRAEATKNQDTPEFLQTGSDVYASLRLLFQSASATKDTAQRIYRSSGSTDVASFAAALRKIGARGEKLLEQAPAPLPEPDRRYIPVLRGLRPLRKRDPQTAPPDYYADRTHGDYFDGNKDHPTQFTGLTLFQDVRKLLLGHHRERQRIVEFQQFLSSVFFEGQDVILVPKHDDDVLHVKIGDEADRPIYSLGDGIQQAIILSFLPFTATKPTFFFIEEPELHMHPGMQRKLLDFYVNHERCQDHHFFITTHSNHLLDMTADYEIVSVINFRKRLKKEATADGDKEPEFVVQPMDAGDESVLLDLGVRKSSVFLVNATVWVEGITDRLYLRRFMELYHAARAGDPSFTPIQEDVHYAFLEYGGGNVTHFFLDEDKSPSITLNRVCGKVFLLIDEDGPKKQERKKRLEEKVGGHYAVTPGREIENLLPIETIHAVVSDYEQKNGGSAPPPPAKPKPHREAKLGEYVEQEFFNGSGWRRKGGYRADSGTIKGKVDFCHKAIEKLTKFDELSPEVQELVSRIHEFVVRQNS